MFNTKKEEFEKFKLKQKNLQKYKESSERHPVRYHRPRSKTSRWL